MKQARNEELTDDAVEETDDSASGLAAALAGGEAGSDFVVAESKSPSINRSSLVLFVLVLLGAGVMYLMVLRTGPQTAGASTETAAANETINQFLAGGASNILNMERMLRQTERVVQQFLTYPSLKQVPLEQLQSNPFKHQKNAPVHQQVEAEELARKRREAERVAALQAVQGLQLQSVLVAGERRACLINNTLYNETDQVEQFTIEKISPDSVVVRTGAYRFKLTLSR